MRRPHGLYAERSGERTLLRAGNSLDNIGLGPAELHGVRIGPRFMRGRQRICRRGGGRIGVSTGARLEFKAAHLGLRWWKFHHAARFELWRLDRRGRRARRVRIGPKVSYRLRDLRRTRPWLRRSPASAVSRVRHLSARLRITLGTSPGWSDVYPPTYPEQWINVTGLRGCFAYVHVADPRNGIFESDEWNNDAQVIVRLPFRPDARRAGCRGGDRGRPAAPSPY